MDDLVDDGPKDENVISLCKSVLMQYIKEFHKTFLPIAPYQG
jgi:hypothetical protein